MNKLGMKTRINSGFVKRRWMEFRQGYATYLTFIFGFSNFIFIAYNFAPFIKNHLNLEVFGIAFFFAVIPLAVWIGHIHFKKQVPTESIVGADLQPYKDKIQPESKEFLANKFNLRNLDYQLWSIDMQFVSTNISIKQMEMMNFMLAKLGAPDEMMYKNEADMIRKWQEDLKAWKENLEKWRKAYQHLHDGHNASELVKHV